MALLLNELVERYATNARELRSMWIAAAAVGLVGSLLILVRWPRRVPGWLTALFTIPLLGAAVIWACTLASVCDDAFISYRYAENWARGLGPVWNAGERVEGYTNFLWMAYAAAAIAIGVSPIEATLVLSVACFVGVLVVVTRLVRQLAPERAPVTVSFAAAAVAGNYVLASFATSGLETMLCAFLVLLAVERASAGAPLQAGLCGIAATMAHPDHAVFYVSLGAVLMLEQNRWWLLKRYALPAILIYLPYFAWRYGYYGELLPNTYHAKEAGGIHFSQGRTYLVVSLVGANAALVLPLALFGLLTNLRTLLARFSYLAIPVYLVHVAKIGGDFMLGRLLVPVLPFAFILAELGARRIFAARRGWVRLFGIPAVAAVMLAAVPVRVIPPHEKVWLLADERTYWPLKSLRPFEFELLDVYLRQAMAFRRGFTDKGLWPCYATGSLGILGYFSRLPLLDTFGLNDWTIARMPVLKRGRPGHEKAASEGDVLLRGVDVADFEVFPHPYVDLTTLSIEEENLFLASYRPELLDPVAHDPKIRFQDIRALIDRYDPRAQGFDREQIACDAWFYSIYYFRNAEDEPRRRSFLDRLVRADPTLAGLEDLLLEPRDPLRTPGVAGADRDWRSGSANVMADLAKLGELGWEIVAREGFDQLASWDRSGEAFTFAPTKHSIPGQSTVAYRVGPFVTSWHMRAGEEPTGVLLSPPFKIEGDVILLRVGGGKHARDLRVSLMVDGQAQSSATGCNTEVLGRRVWNVASLRGKSVRLEIVDLLQGGWGHITVDELVQLRRRAPFSSVGSTRSAQ